MSSQKTTIKDIAKACNVSISTVSRVLNQTGQIKESTSRLILEKAKEMNYIPNGLARSIARTGNNVNKTEYIQPLLCGIDFTY